MNTSVEKLGFAEVVACMKIINDPTRLMILKLVSEKEYCVCQFVDMFEMSQPSISQHLKKLKDAGLVSESRKGQWRFYSLNLDSSQFEFIQFVLGQITNEDQAYQTLLQKEKAVDCS